MHEKENVERNPLPSSLEGSLSDSLQSSVSSSLPEDNAALVVSPDEKISLNAGDGGNTAPVIPFEEQASSESTPEAQSEINPEAQSEINPEETRALTPEEIRIDALRQGTSIKNKYRCIAASSVQKFWPCKALGVPVFAPPILLSSQFSIFALCFGPFYYFFTGMWRKGLLISLITVFFMVLEAYLSIDIRSLESIIIEEYFDIYVGLVCVSSLLVLSLCKGWRVLAFVLGLSMMGFLFVVKPHVEDLHIGVSTAFMWMVGGIIGMTFMTLSFFNFLARQWVMFAICATHLIVFFMTGLPLSFRVYTVPALFFSILLGSQALWDRYRHSVLGERFWW